VIPGNLPIRPDHAPFIFPGLTRLQDFLFRRTDPFRNFRREQLPVRPADQCLFRKIQQLFGSLIAAL
jgi:hypothetical protein